MWFWSCLCSARARTGGNIDDTLGYSYENGTTTGMLAYAKLLQNVEIYLEKRIRQLDDYLMSERYSSYSEFLDLMNTDLFIKFDTELNECKQKLLNFIRERRDPLLAGKSAEDLNSLLLDSLDRNPLADK